MSEAEKIAWFLDATSAVARDAIANFGRTQWLFFSPGGTSFALVPVGEEAPFGFVSAADEALPAETKSLSQLTAWIRWKTQGLPHYPKGA